MSTNGPTCTCDAIEVTAKCPACPTAADQTPATKRVEQIRARLDAATDGPWFQGRENAPYESVCDVYSKRSPDEPDSHDIATYIWSAEDAALIAHSRDDIPWLLNQLAEQAATIERLDLAAQETDWPAVSRALAVARALGSQRTEGQG